MKLTVNGRAVFATTGGTAFDPTKPAVVFLHGAGFDRTGWRLQTRWFARHLGVSLLRGWWEANIAMIESLALVTLVAALFS